MRCCVTDKLNGALPPNKQPTPTNIANTDPNKMLNQLAQMGKDNENAPAPKTLGSRLGNAAKVATGQAAGGIAGGVAGTEAGKAAGAEAGKAAGKAAANAAIDAANNVTFGLANLGRGAAEKVGETVGGAAGKMVGGLAGNSVGNNVGSAAGGLATKNLNAGTPDEAAANGDGASGPQEKQKDDMLDKALQHGGQKVADGAKTAANVSRAMNALNPANLAAKAGAAAKEGLAALGKSIVDGTKAAGKFIADKAVAGAKAVGGLFKGAVAKGSQLLGHVGLHGSAATATSAVVTTSLVITPVVGGPVAIYNANKVKNSSDLFALCLAYSNDKSEKGLENVTLPKGNAVEASAQRNASETKVVSVMRTLGHSDVQIAGTLSNFRAEGSSDPTVFEFGKNWGGQVFMSSQDQGGAYVKSPQKIKAGEWSAANPLSTTGQGFGYGQMTPAGPFFAWAKLKTKDAFDPGVQLAYQMSSVTNNKYPWSTYLKATASMTDPKAAASWFYYGWEYPGYGGQASAAPGGVQQYAAAHIAEADEALSFVKTVTTDKDYAEGVISAIENDVTSGAQNNTPATVDKNESNTSRPDFCDNLDSDTTSTKKAKAGSGVAPAGDLGKFMKPSELSEEMRQFVEIDPAQYGLDYGTWNGWEGANGLLTLHNEGILTTCTQLVAALGYKMYGIRNVSGNGYELVGKWQGLDPQGKTSNTPEAGAIFSFSPGNADGNNHTGIVSHVFANGDVLAVENGIMTNPSPTHDAGTWSYHVYPKATMDKVKASYFMPSKKAIEPKGDNFFGSKS